VKAQAFASGLSSTEFLFYSGYPGVLAAVASLDNPQEGFPGAGKVVAADEEVPQTTMVLAVIKPARFDGT